MRMIIQKPKEAFYLSSFYSISRGFHLKSSISRWKLSSDLDAKSATVKVAVDELSAAPLLLVGVMGCVNVMLKEQSLQIQAQKS